MCLCSFFIQIVHIMGMKSGLPDLSRYFSYNLETSCLAELCLTEFQICPQRIKNTVHVRVA